MAKYRVTLPKPSVKRMYADRKLIVSVWPSHDPDLLVDGVEPERLVYDLSEEALGYEFEVSEDRPWQYSKNHPNQGSFTVESVYRNATGSREERKKLVPEKL